MKTRKRRCSKTAAVVSSKPESPECRRKRLLLKHIAADNLSKANRLVTKHVRDGIWSQSLLFKILAPEQITPDQLDRDVDERNRVIVEMEPNVPAARFGDAGDGRIGDYVTGSRYIVPITLRTTRKTVPTIPSLYTMKDPVANIGNYHISEGLDILDGGLLDCVDRICVDSDREGAPSHFTGKVQWKEFDGPMDRNGLSAACCLLAGGDSKGRFRRPNHTVLMNDLTALSLLHEEGGRWVGEVKGGPTADDVLAHGLSVVKEVFGYRLLLYDRIPDGVVYFFTNPATLGHCYYIDDWTMWMNKEAYLIGMFGYWLGGWALGDVSGVAKAVFPEVRDHLAQFEPAVHFKPAVHGISA